MTTEPPNKRLNCKLGDEYVLSGEVTNTPYTFEDLKRNYNPSIIETIQNNQEPLSFMVIYIKQVNRWNVSHLTYRSEPQCPENQMTVPVYKLYGVTKEGYSVCANIYGFFPFIYLDCYPTINEYTSIEIVKELEKRLEEKDIYYCPRISYKKQMKRVIKYEITNAFTCSEFVYDPSAVLKVTLAIPQYVKCLGDALCYGLISNMSNEDKALRIETPSFGYIKTIPFMCLDAITQFQMESEISGMGWITINKFDIVQSDSYDRGLSNIEINASFANMVSDVSNTDIAPLRILHFDIECASLKGGFPTAQNDPIISIATLLSNEKDEVIKKIAFQHGSADDIGEDTLHIRFMGKNDLAVEKKMFSAWGDLIKKYYDPDIIIGHNSNAFDIPYMIERAHVLNEMSDCLGRAKYSYIPSKSVEKKRKNGDITVTKDSTVIGRILLDTYCVIKSDTTKKEESYGLGALAQKYLKDNKDEMGYKMLLPNWRTSDQTRARICKYNMKDTVLTYRLCKLFAMISDCIQMARVTGVMPHTLLKSGQQVKVWMQMLRKSINPKWEPNPSLRAIFPYELPKERRSDDKFQGATVIKPVTGFHRKVAVADYASLYPSMMVKGNTCPSTLVRDPKVLKDLKAKGMLHISPTNNAFVVNSIRPGILPKLLCDLLEARKQARAELAKAKDPYVKMAFNSRQLALKIVANSTYGFTSASGGKLVRMEIATSVTSWGREHIEIAAQTARNFGCKVLYGDTDSVMITNDKAKDVGEMFAILKQVCETVTKTINCYPVVLQAEKVYEPYLLLKKKRYVGYLWENASAPKYIDNKGIETARRDYCKFVKQTLAAIIKMLMECKTHNEIMIYAHNQIKLLLEHKVDIFDLIITRSLSKLVYANKQPHAELAKRMVLRNTGFVMNTGERIPYVIINRPGEKLISMKSEDPTFVIEKNCPIDYEYYAMNQLKKPMVRILCAVIANGDEKLAETMLFGTQALNDIKRIVEHSNNLGIDKFFKPVIKCVICGLILSSKTDGNNALYCIKCNASEKSIEHQNDLKKQLTDIEDSYSKLKSKCAECRGYDDDSACVQIDCHTTFEKSMCNKKMKILREKILKVE
jgi:DNA polymerase delta subunit 1